MKYIKISLILTCICLLCALGVAGVNYITAPIIAENQLKAKMEAYKKIFPEADFEKSEIIDKDFKSTMVKERFNAKNTNGEELGYAFQTTGKNSYGPLTLIIGISTEADGYTIVDVVATENGQTGGRNEMVNEFIGGLSGMTSEEAANAQPVSGATFGCNLAKQQIAAAYAELGIMSDDQKKLVEIFGESVDMGKSIKDETLIYPVNIKLGYEVKDASGATLGYYYEVNATNRFGNVMLTVALNPDKSVKTLKILENNQTGGRDEKVEEFVGSITNGMTGSDVINLAPIAGATYGSNIVKGAILAAMSEANGTYDDNAAKYLVPFISSSTRSEKETELVSDQVTDSVKYYSTSKGEEKWAGTLVSVKGANKVPDNDNATIALKVAIDAAGNLVTVFITDNGQTAGRDVSLSKFLSQLDNGMTPSESMDIDIISGATMASEKALDLLGDAFWQVTGEKPEIPTEGYDSFYLKQFEGVDLAKSTAISEEDFKEFEDGEYKGHTIEGKVLVDASGKELGKAVVVSGENQYGIIELMVSVDPTGYLNKVSVIKNGQSYADKMVGYEDNFKPGMSIVDIDGVDAAAGATYGSNLMKKLIKLGIEVGGGGYNPFYLEMFEGADLTKSEALSNFADKRIISGMKVCDANGTLLGYAYIIHLTNVYSDNVIALGLNANGTYKTAISVSTTHDDLSAALEIFKDGDDWDTINGYVNNPSAGGTYSVDLLRTATRIAMAEAGFVGDDDKLEVKYEGLAKEMFPDAIWARSYPLEITTNKDYVSWAYQVCGPNFEKNILGAVYVVTLENSDYVLSLMVAVDKDNNYKDARVVSLTPKRPLIQGGDNMLDKVNAYIETIPSGSTIHKIDLFPTSETMNYTSHLVKNAIIMALNTAKNTAYTAKPFNDYQLFAMHTFDNVGKVEMIKNFNNKEVKSGATIYDIDGKELGKAFIVKLDGVYSMNYMLITLKKEEDGTYTYYDIYDVENNHANLIGDGSQYFNPGMSVEDVNNVEYDASSHASFSIEAIKNGILIAFDEVKDVAGLEYNKAMQQVYPLMVEGRSVNVKSQITDTTNITNATVVVGVYQYTTNVTLGYALEVKATDSLSFVVGISLDGTTLMTSTAGFAGPDCGVPVVLYQENEALNPFLAQLKAGMSLDDIKKLEAKTDDEKAIVAGLEKAFAEVQKLNEKVPGEVYSLLHNYDFFKGADVLKTEKLAITNTANVLGAYKVKDSNGNDLGNLYKVKITNIYSWHIFYIALVKDGDTIKLNKIIDFDNDHHGSKNDITEHINKFNQGMTYQDVVNLPYDADAHATYTMDQIKLGIKVAMVEFGYEDKNIQYELAAKTIFTDMVTWHSKKLSDDVLDSKEKAEFGYEVRGTKNFQSNQLIGFAYAYNINDNLTIMIGVNADNSLQGVVAIKDSNNVFGDWLANFIINITDQTIDNIQNIEGHEETCKIIKELVKKLSEHNPDIPEGGNE